MSTVDIDPGSTIAEPERRAIRLAALAWARRGGGDTVLEDACIDADLRWRPHLYCAKAKLAIHLLLYAGIGSKSTASFLDAKTRISNLRIAIVGPERFIRVPAVLDIAAQASTSIVILHMNGQVAEYSNVFEAIYREGFIVPPESYKSLATRILRAAMTAQRAEKGQLLETLLAFLLSQVPGFSVKGTNYNTATEEIDIVVHNRRIGGILASHQEPIILVECKNQVGKAGKNEYVSFASKIKNRHQSASVGLFVSINGYTRDFIEESLRDSHERIIVARLSRSDIEQWTANHGEEAAAILDTLIEKAILE